MNEIETSSAQKDRLPELLQGSPDALAAWLSEVHPADLAEWMLDLEESDAWSLFERLPKETRVQVLRHAEDELRTRLLQRLSPREIGEVVEEMPADEVVDLLALADDAVAEQVLRSVDFERARDLRRLALHPHDTAGGLMTTEFVSVPLGTRIGDAIKLIKTEGEEVEEGGGLWVVDDNGRPAGYVQDRMLLTHSIHDDVDGVMVEPVTTTVDRDQEEVANLFLRYGLDELAVIDESGVLIGVITADDAHEVIGEEADEDLLRIVGASPVQQTRLPILKRVAGRLPLQGVTVVGGLITAWIIDMALAGTGELSTHADLLRFVPIVIGLAGNVGIQSSTILVRAFATGEVEPDRELSVLGSETFSGLLIGLICGALTLLVILLSESDPDAGSFAFAVASAITCAVTWAAFLGCMVPMACRRIGIDPAVVAGPFLITVSDISGTSLYLGVAHVLLVT
jgi:magnesium transporter